MRITRKFLIALLALCLIFSMVTPVLSVSAATTLASGECGDYLTWELDNEGTLTISGEGEMEDFDQYSRPFSGYRDYVKSVIINDGVTSIGDAVFRDCYSLTSVTIGNSVTSISNCVFYDCISLNKIKFEGKIPQFGEDCFLQSGIQAVWSSIISGVVVFGVIFLLIIVIVARVVLINYKKKHKK